MRPASRTRHGGSRNPDLNLGAFTSSRHGDTTVDAYRGGIAANVRSMFSWTPSVERTPACR
jgi:hypothetical protein